MKKLRLSTEQVFAAGFLGIIFLGAVLLMFPECARSRTWTSFPDTLFTAVSATCVTGLVVIDTGTHWSILGQCIILTMIQVGGLGFMSFAMLLAGRGRVSPRVRNLAAASFGMSELDGTKTLVTRIFAGTGVIEGVGALLLMIRTIPMYGVGRGIFYGLFLSVSAFCNAGFDPMGDEYGEFASLTEIESDPLFLLTFSALIILGAAGFLVWSDLWEHFRRGKRLSVYSRFVLNITVALLVGGTILIAWSEWNNPDTIGNYPVWRKLTEAFFQSVTTRTAGFDSIGQSAMTDRAKAVSMFLMLVGGASGSTAGGVKVGTIGVLAALLWSTLRGRRDVNVLGRSLPWDTVRRALTVVCSVLAEIFVFAFLIAASDGIPLESALYECFSAFCTVGLSLSLTPTLGVFSRILIMIAMYTGRVGILTLSCALARKSDEDEIAYPPVEILIG